MRWRAHIGFAQIANDRETRLKIALIGATGFVGSRLLNEALNRGHTVTAIVRNPAKLPSREHLTSIATDINDVVALTQALLGNDVVVYAYKPAKEESLPMRLGNHARAIASTIAATKAAGINRILAVGGAGTLHTASGGLHMHAPEFPPRWEGGAKSTAMIKDVLKYEQDLQWTVLSPSHDLFAGERTGKFRLGLDEILVGADGQSRISAEDYAVAMIDELEQPKHTGRRFTLGY